MKKKTINVFWLRTVAFVLLFSLVRTVFSQEVENDSLDVRIDLEELIVYPHENQQLRGQAVSYSSLNMLQNTRCSVDGLSDLSSVVPNFHMPEYGSKITSSIFLRGVGARMDEPSVGLYVDNVPCLEKSAFDFSFFDLARIEVLRGPQGTLYGRNSIGGLLRVTTLSPFDYQGLRAKISYGSRNDLRANLSYYHKVKEKLAFSLAGFYAADDGFFRNELTGKRNDQRSAGGRAKLEWRISREWHSAFSLSYENVGQNAYPYFEYDAETGRATRCAYDAPGTYDRNLLSSGLIFQRRDGNLLFTSTTGFQHLDDEMCLDQDFSPDSIFALRQKKNQHSLTQEFTLRSNHARKYQWVSGFFGFFRRGKVNSPMTLYASGFRRLVPDMPPFVTIDADIEMPGHFTLPDGGAAIYHESSYTFLEKLTATVGLRLDYERTQIDYRTFSDLHATAVVPAMGRPVSVAKRYVIDDSEKDDYWTILPKFSLKYTINNHCMIYASVAKGYKAGGFNYTMFSNTVQQAMRNVMQSDLRQPEEVLDARNSVSYKPEYSWNYELGLHSEMFGGRLLADFSTYFVHLEDQQIITYVSNGSRMVSNAARSRNCGLELSASAHLTENFSLGVSYGYLHAVFRKYATSAADCAGNFIPFAPGHTFSANAAYSIPVRGALLEKIVLSAVYSAAGKIYFSEENDIRQRYYGVLNGNLAFCRKNMELSGWIKNAANERYYTFYCESVGRKFVQKGTPLQAGASFSVHF